MKQVKVNLMVIAAITIAVMTMSFRANIAEQLYWFEADEQSGLIGDFLVMDNTPGGNCISEVDVDPLCAVAFSEADIGNPNNPTPPIHELKDDTGEIKDERYQILE